MSNQNKRSWNILNWNVRGLNSDDKRNAVRAKIEESSCVIICLQETKMQALDHSEVRKMAPKRFNKYAYIPSDGASGGIFMGWNSSILTGQVLYTSKFALTVKFTAVHNAEEWKLTSVYGPCQGQQRQEFIEWFNSLRMDDDINWMFIGDFNFYRSLENRNKEGGNMHDIMVFNEALSNLGLQEIPLKGRSYTWSNMQQDPLMEQLDWCFTSTNWISDYPNTLMIPLAKTTSDHVPCVVQIGTSIPKAQVFRFENFWTDQPGFLEVVQSVWASEVTASNSVSRVAAKFKNLRRALRKWAMSLSKLKNILKQNNAVLLVMDKLEESRPLNTPEKCFRDLLKNTTLSFYRIKKTIGRKGTQSGGPS
jgi:exonuclease III